jgi:chaperonin cofactor prefoldin
MSVFKEKKIETEFKKLIDRVNEKLKTTYLQITPDFSYKQFTIEAFPKRIDDYNIYEYYGTFLFRGDKDECQRFLRGIEELLLLEACNS